MKLKLLYIFLLLGFLVNAQDKIHLLDGTLRTGRIKEVGIKVIKYTSERELISISKQEVLLIEFENGTLEIINKPSQDVVVASEWQKNKENIREKKNEKTLQKNNIVSLNTLALCNADLSLFYEYLFNEKRIGLGVMGAYNLNNYAGLLNNYIFQLTNGKKNYDLGATINCYWGDEAEKRNMYVGILFKYTSLQFSRPIFQNTPPYNVIIGYAPEKGYQLSTIFTTGTLHKLSDNLVIRTMFGIGGFNLKDNYKKEYNFVNNRGSRGSGRERTFLPKLYLGINIGFNF